MGPFICWCNNNQGFISMVLSIITILVTLYVMYKSNNTSKKISEKQVELEKSIALRQEDIQRQQTKIATYPYRIECWVDLYKLKEQTENLKFIFSIVDYSELSYSEIAKRLSYMDTLYSSSLLSLAQFLNLFPVNNGMDMVVLKSCIIKNQEIIAKFKVFGDCLSKDEELQKSKEKAQDIIQFTKGLNLISEQLINALNVAEKDLYIGNLSGR